MSGSLDLETLQESVAVGRKTLSQYVALEWTGCELLISVRFSSWLCCGQTGCSGLIQL